MTGQGGHFEKGRWVVDQTHESSEDKGKEINQVDIDNRIRDATQSVIRGVGDLLQIGHDLVATDEGRDHIDKKIEKKVRKLEEVCDDLSQEAEELISRIKKKIKR